MDEMTSVTLAKALKLKNRLAGRVSKLTQDIQTYNSIQDGAESINVKDRLTERAETVRLLTELKYAIFRANEPVQKAIFELAELKAEVALLTGLNTKHGKYKEGYPASGEVSYTAQFRKQDVDAMVAQLEIEIDQHQDRLDRFNHETVIKIDRRATEMGRG